MKADISITGYMAVRYKGTEIIGGGGGQHRDYRGFLVLFKKCEVEITYVLFLFLSNVFIRYWRLPTFWGQYIADCIDNVI